MPSSHDPPKKSPPMVPTLPHLGSQLLIKPSWRSGKVAVSTPKTPGDEPGSPHKQAAPVSGKESMLSGRRQGPRPSAVWSQPCSCPGEVQHLPHALPSRFCCRGQAAREVPGAVQAGRLLRSGSSQAPGQLGAGAVRQLGVVVVVGPRPWLHAC